MIKIILICTILCIITFIIAFYLGMLVIRRKVMNSIENNYFGCMIANLDLQEKDNFIETHFYYSPREILGREFVIFEVKIRE